MTMHRLGFYPFAAVAQAFPVIADQVTTNISGTTLTPTINLPSGIVAGDLILAHLNCSNRPDEKCNIWPDGWIPLSHTNGGTAGIWSAYRRATGGETSVTLTVTNNGPARSYAGLAQRITGAHATIPPELIQTGAESASSATGDPPNNVPSWGSAKTLFIEMAGMQNTRTVSAYSTGYTLNQIAFSNTGTASTIISAARELQAASDDPGTFTINTAATMAVRTIAIPPAGLANGYPNIMACRTSRTTGSVVSSHVVDMPAGIVAGEMLLVFIATTLTLTAPAGWNTLWAPFNDGSNRWTAAYYRIATGSEAATYTWTTATTTRIVAHVYRVNGNHASAAPEAAASPVTGSSATPNPPSLTPSWGSAKTLWFNCVHKPVSFDSMCNPPIEYTHGCTAMDEGNATKVLGVAARRNEAASEDPTTWLTPSGAWIANTFAVRPA